MPSVLASTRRLGVRMQRRRCCPERRNAELRGLPVALSASSFERAPEQSLPAARFAMADSSAQDKNLPASQRRLEKAREDGQVARSRDLGHFAAIAVGSALVAGGAPHVAAVLREAIADSLRFDGAHALGADAMAERLGALTTTWAWAVLPFGR